MFNLTPIAIPDLTGKVILLTGAGRGIGAVLTGLLVSKGAVVYGGMRSDSEPPWQAHLEGARLLPLDITNPQHIDRAIAQITDEAGRLDALINNAGVITPIAPIDSLASDELSRAFDINAVGLHRMTQAALPALRAAGGVVVNAGTGAATTALEGWGAYCASKAAARMLTMCYADAFADSGVQFFFIGIPPTDTNMQGVIRASGINPISQIPQKDLVAPEVPASVMAWLCSTDARKLDAVLLDVREEPFQSMMGV